MSEMYGKFPVQLGLFMSNKSRNLLRILTINSLQINRFLGTYNSNLLTDVKLQSSNKNIMYKTHFMTVLFVCFTDQVRLNN